MLIKKNVRADFAAFGFSSFHTKYITSPTKGTKQSVMMFTTQFGLSSSNDLLIRTPQ